MLSYVTRHLKSISSYTAVLLTVLGVLMASGALGTGTLLHIAGYVVAIATALGFKSLPPPAQPVVPPAAGN